MASRTCKLDTLIKSEFSITDCNKLFLSTNLLSISGIVLNDKIKEISNVREIDKLEFLKGV